MSDLISRQVAIGAIRILYPDMPKINFMDNISNWQKKNEKYIECENAIFALPSAEITYEDVMAYCKPRHLALTTVEFLEHCYNHSSAEKRGEWLWSPIDKDGTVSGCCSECSFSHIFIGGHTAQYQYCPNCGARMTKGED